MATSGSDDLLHWRLPWQGRRRSNTRSRSPSPTRRRSPSPVPARARSKPDVADSDSGSSSVPLPRSQSPTSPLLSRNDVWTMQPAAHHKFPDPQVEPQEPEALRVLREYFNVWDGTHQPQEIKAVVDRLWHPEGTTDVPDAEGIVRKLPFKTVLRPQLHALADAGAWVEVLDLVQNQADPEHSVTYHIRIHFTDDHIEGMKHPTVATTRDGKIFSVIPGDPEGPYRTMYYTGAPPEIDQSAPPARPDEPEAMRCLREYFAVWDGTHRPEEVKAVVDRLWHPEGTMDVLDAAGAIQKLPFKTVVRPKLHAVADNGGWLQLLELAPDPTDPEHSVRYRLRGHLSADHVEEMKNPTVTTTRDGKIWRVKPGDPEGLYHTLYPNVEPKHAVYPDAPP